ncbi:hypothetical protein [Rhodococcus sp. Q]|uniref:hypothetical protein n=1 Tax=Rhodococcus sp. Q TaxID=2502252 RepID=UPI0010F76609|nr:hypothetical protein [Rhodococcus sp. Q]
MRLRIALLSVTAAAFAVVTPLTFAGAAMAEQATGCVVGSGTMSSGDSKTTSNGTFITCNNGMVCNYRRAKGGGSTEVCRWAPASIK